MRACLGLDAVQTLRELADAIESGRLRAEQCVIVHGAPDGYLRVVGCGEADSLQVIGTLRLGEQIMLNTLMPFGNLR